MKGSGGPSQVSQITGKGVLSGCRRSTLQGVSRGSAIASRSLSGMDEVEPTVEDAILLAARLHRGVRYPSPEAEPYVFHPLRVMLRFADPVDQTAAVLHDVVEDTVFTVDDLRHAGYRPEVIDAIDALTHRTHDSYERYIERVAQNPVARRVKIADIEDNLANNQRSPVTLENADRIRRYEAALDRLRVT
jgi:(p)ppGpp synthase/HD superfamily hydrolase